MKVLEKAYLLKNYRIINRISNQNWNGNIAFRIIIMYISLLKNPTKNTPTFSLIFLAQSLHKSSVNVESIFPQSECDYSSID